MGGQSAFSRLKADESVAKTVRDLQVALQAELLRAGSYWEESLCVLREIANHGKTFPGATDALSWYRSTDHAAV